MTSFIYDWESSLLLLAHQATIPHRTELARQTLHSDQLLEWSYAYCEQITAVHSRSFFLASRLLPPPKRRAVRALYAFCRTTDDIVDDAEGDRAVRLQRWRTRALGDHVQSHDPVPTAWRDACIRYHIPQTYAEQLIDGVARDLSQTRYQTFAELAEYAYGVASTVGLMSMHIVGFRGEEAIPYAVRLGVALQLTNILRDVGEDWQRGRFYLPLEELHSFGLTEADVAAGEVTDGWRNFMRFQIERNRRLYQEAWPGIGMLNKDGRLAIGAAADFYAAILDDIEENDYDVFNRRAYVNGWGKMRRIPKLWWQTRVRPSF